MREYLANIFMISVSLALLVHLALIAWFGGYFIQEPNKAILASETVMLIAFVVFGCFNLYKLVTR